MTSGRGRRETPAEALRRRQAEAANGEGGEPNGEPGEGGEQESYIAPDVPQYAILPPTGTMFANATWMQADARIVAIVQKVLGFEEMHDIMGLDYDVVWRRNGKPFRNGEPIFATVDIAPARWVWQAARQELITFPRYVVDIRWPHFDDMRRGKADGDTDSTEHLAGSVEYVHEEVLERHIHEALMGLDVTNDIVTRKAPDFAGYAATVKRYGQFSSGLAAIAGQLAMWPSRDE